MSEHKCAEKIFLPHHEQQELCTTRLPYRQGRKLTAVKVYTINNESNHLLIFGVPSLNLRQEVKSLFLRFGKLLQFNITTDHPAEIFTETYHARFEKIPSARIAKNMLDTKNFYGGSLHVCYAPELESFDETRQKILKRKQDVLYRIRHLEMEVMKGTNKIIIENYKEDTTAVAADDDSNYENNKRTINMGEENTIIMSKKCKKYAKIKKIKPTPILNEIDTDEDGDSKIDRNNFDVNKSRYFSNASSSKTNNINVVNKCDVHDKSNTSRIETEEIDIVDFTSADKEVVSNINEALNYNQFGNEVIRKIPYKPVNKIVFNINNKKS